MYGKKKSKDPFNHMIKMQKEENSSVFDTRPSKPAKKSNSINPNPTGPALPRGGKAPKYELNPGPSEQDFYTGAQDPTTDPIDDNSADVPDGPCYNLLGQEVGCGNCPPGSLVENGQCIGGGSDNDDSAGYVTCPDGTLSASYEECFDQGENCSPSYNVLGQCIACCDGEIDPGGNDDDTGNDSGYEMCPDGTFVLPPDTCGDGGTGNNCSPQYNMLGQCIACCD
tara:strand:- start:1710 stop:2384 length:675 start_codon:yes stop_codon:yes gene_type:complete